MTIAEVLAEVDELKPNQYDDSMKIKWISKLEGKIINEIISTHETTTTTASDSDTDDIDTDTTDTADTTDTTSTTVTTDAEDEAEFGGYTEDDLDTTLVVPDTYADVYRDYCFAMIDYVTGELARYTNSMIMFNASYQAFSNWYNRTHTPKTNTLKIF